MIGQGQGMAEQEKRNIGEYDRTKEDSRSMHTQVHRHSHLIALSPTRTRLDTNSRAHLHTHSCARDLSVCMHIPTPLDRSSAQATGLGT
eukprot:scaffold44725_cov19-Tisochrysis_lutea.AAC.1